MRPVYDHVQKGTLARIIAAMVLAIVVAMIAMVSFSEASTESRAAAVAVVVLAVAFSSLALLALRRLRVVVTPKQIVVTMGLGFIRRVIAVESVRSAEPVINPWYYGWGVRLTPDGWMFNVSGFGAVRLTLQSGQTFRIGTDEPAALAAAIRQVQEIRTSR